TARRAHGARAAGLAARARRPRGRRRGLRRVAPRGRPRERLRHPAPRRRLRGHRRARLAGVSGTRRWIVLLALAGSACTKTVAVRPLTAPGWDGCGVAELQGTVRNVLCPGLDLRLLRTQGLSGATGVDAIAKSIPGGDATQPEVLRAAGDIAIPMRVHPDFLIAAPRPDVLAVCRDSNPTLSRCRAAISAIAQSGLPAGVTFPETRLELLGRPLVVPPDCQLVTERIVCPTTGFAVDWREQEWTDGADAAITASTRALRSRFKNVDEERIPCT